ncbi:endonuclease [Gemmatimonadota bacterium Y43]|uniref:endonuclease n=1 Tax=Gaopeijia maritima TaxID=3119007 RepID=UPI00327B8F49
MAKSVYDQIIESIFSERFATGDTEVSFERDALVETARALGLKRPKNLGDVIYTYRYRRELPATIREEAPDDQEWVIRGDGDARYVMRLVPISRIEPNPNLAETKIPDATPEIIASHSLSDEQALLAKVRYNRLIDIFLGITAYSLQNHLRTKVSGIGQVEVDELYVGVDDRGAQYIVPVQAKGGSDKLGVIQTEQDMAFCSERFPALACRPVSAQFLAHDHIALFELTLQDEAVRILRERHYRLVPGSAITASDLASYRRS